MLGPFLSRASIHTLSCITLYIYIYINRIIIIIIYRPISNRKRNSAQYSHLDRCTCCTLLALNCCFAGAGLNALGTESGTLSSLVDWSYIKVQSTTMTSTPTSTVRSTTPTEEGKTTTTTTPTSTPTTTTTPTTTKASGFTYSYELEYEGQTCKEHTENCSPMRFAVAKQLT